MNKHPILFVDDEPSVLDAIRRGLRNQRGRWSMHFARGVTEALKEVQKNSFDAIVTDITMPGRGGLDLLAELQENDDTKSIPVIILTGLGGLDLKRRALEMGAFDLLNKPVLAEDLIARLQSVLRLKSHQDELIEYKENLERKVRERTLELEQSHQVRERTLELEQSHLEMVWRLAKVGEYRDELTGNHVVRQADKDRILQSVGPIHQFLQKPCDEEVLKFTIARTINMGNMLSSKELRGIVSEIESLPSLPSHQQHLMNELQTPDVSAKQIGISIG